MNRIALFLGAALSFAYVGVPTAYAVSPVSLAKEGRGNKLPSGGHFTWKFDKRPALGAVIMKIRAYSKAKKQESPYEIIGEYGMPSMRAHDSGPLKFQLNKKGDYLLPINVVMPGDWEIVIRIKRDGKEIYVGKIGFSV